jgi:hypothetical protein
MKWALIYLLSLQSYPEPVGSGIWDTGFRYSTYDECTQEVVSICFCFGLFSYAKNGDYVRRRLTNTTG